MPNVLHWEVPAGETYVKAECTRGEYGYYLVTDGSQFLRRVHVRGPSYTHAICGDGKAGRRRQYRRHRRTDGFPAYLST